MSAMRHPAVHWTLGIVLGGVFVYASLDKIANPGEFARIVYHYRLIGPSQMVGPWAANTLAVTLPWVELVVGLALISSRDCGAKKRPSSRAGCWSSSSSP